MSTPEQAMQCCDSMPAHRAATSTARKLQDDAVHARAFCTAGFDAWFILHTRFRRRALLLFVHRTLMFPSRRPYDALPRAANFPNSGFLTSSHLVSLPVVPGFGW